MEDYEEFFLYDNGIGMSRDFIDVVTKEAAAWQAPPRPIKVGVLTGLLGELIFRDYLKAILQPLPGMELVVLAIENRLFGPKITVSGLLPGRELLAALSRLPADLDAVILPPNTLNAQKLFLDDLSLEDFRRQAQAPVLVPESGLLGCLQDLASLRA
jgi:NifB/MoaA-like Fe-S oxidoreductase